MDSIITVHLQETMTPILTFDENNYQARAVTTSTGELGALETFMSENQDKNQAQFWSRAHTEHAY